MKKTYSIIFSVLFSAVFFSACSYNSDPVNSTPVTNKGIFVLCKGIDTTIPGDYSYINLENNTVTNNVYQLNNSGSTMGYEPYDIYRYLDHDLFISVTGPNSAGGKILHVDSRTNKAVDSAVLNSRTGNFTLALGEFIYTVNLGAGSLSKLDMDLNMVNSSIPVGPEPSNLLFANTRIYVSKFSSTSENSLSVLPVSNDIVTKIYFQVPPVSAALSGSIVCVSTSTNKKIYRIVPENPVSLLDSFAVNVTNDAIGEIAAGTDNNNLFIVAKSNDIGKAVYNLDFSTGNITQFIQESSDLVNISGIVYDMQYETLFVIDSKNGQQNGEVRFYNKLGVLQKTYTVEGRNPVKLAIRY